MAALDNALTTLARAKAHLDISGTTHDSRLTVIIAGVSKFVSTYCRRDFKRQAYTSEEYNGKGQEDIWLKNAPVISGQTFTMQRRTSVLNENDWESIDTEEYFIDYVPARIRKTFGAWQEGFKNYRFTYTAGFYLPSHANYQDGVDDDQDLPFDLELAVMDLISGAFNRRKSGGIQSEKVYQIDITYAKELRDNPMLQQSLDSYKRMGYA